MNTSFILSASSQRGRQVFLDFPLETNFFFFGSFLNDRKDILKQIARVYLFSSQGALTGKGKQAFGQPFYLLRVPFNELNETAGVHQQITSF